MWGLNHFRAMERTTDERIRGLLDRYPGETTRDIAARFGLTREHFSKKYGGKAAMTLVIAFRQAVGRQGRAKPVQTSQVRPASSRPKTSGSLYLASLSFMTMMP